MSRLKGFLNVKGPNPLTPLDRSHIIRRAVLMRDQLVRKTSGIYDPETKTVHISEALLSALLTVSEYRHGARSLNFLLDMSRLSEVERFTPSCLPMEEQLNIHMDAADFQRRLAFEQSMGSVVEKYAETAHETYCETQLKEAERLGMDSDRIQKLRLSPDMRPWGELDEFFKEGYRSQIRYIGQRLEDYDCPIGIRPIYSNAADAITELYGPVLELLAEMEHDRWMKDKISDGWKFGEKKNNALRTTPELVPFADLDKDTQEFIRRSVRHIPENLRKVGYELYRKMR
ncbi:MAG: RyR domain-containing protein [Eubacteriales bacterium]|nr:RyR domain-containing protein [Eubacteriales bacterium]